MCCSVNEICEESWRKLYFHFILINHASGRVGPLVCVTVYLKFSFQVSCEREFLILRLSLYLAIALIFSW